MNAKTYLIVYYSVAGVIISLFTAVMTYYIIDVPIGQKMMFKIFLTIVATLPIIWALSYLIGSCLGGRLLSISTSLNNIHEDKFIIQKPEESITDINEIHISIQALSKRLEESINKLRDSNQQLNNMILSLSHDIKTPLTIIDGYLEELEDDIVTDEDRPKVLGILKKETAYLNELSSSVIYYLQSMNESSNPKEILLKEFLHKEVCPLLRPKKGVALKCEIEEDFKLNFNEMALKKILVNLLHNATKHTSKGSITVRTSKGSIFIQDTGTGIEAKNHERVFEAFFCEDESKNREKSGFGLGLSIARNLAKNSGYHLHLDSSYVHGCRFVLEKG